MAKRLVRLAISSDAGGVDIVPAGSELVADGRNIGALTSIAPAIDGADLRGLGYAHRDVAEPGRVMSVSGQNDVIATILGFAG